MADLTNLRTDLYRAFDVVGRELTGLARAVSMNGATSTSERAAVGDTIKWPVTGKRSTSDVVPAMEAPNASEEEVGNGTFTLTNFKKADPIAWEGEKMRAMNNSGIYETIYGDQLEQAIRALRNEIEQSLLAAGVAGAGIAYGTPGTLPFGTAGDMSDIANIRKILNKTGAPGGRKLVLSLDASANMLSKQSNLFKVNEAGSDELLRAGNIGTLYQFGIGETGADLSHTAGTGTGYVVDGDQDVDTTTIPLITGTGTVLSGDYVTFAGDSWKYMTKTGITAPGDLVLNNPGLLNEVADTTAMTVGSDYVFAGLGFSPDALRLIARPPQGGDKAVDEMVEIDPYSGIGYRIALYPGYHKMVVEVSVVYGAFAVKSENIALLLA